jgi:ADP-dependent NAD(P)H-hydrate dehydratase / NAD(P)H-hydrate epimerase
MVFKSMMMNDIPHDLRKLPRKDIFNSSRDEAKKRIKSFDVFAHKGTRGHAAIIAGSPGMMGAAILATSAAMHSGCGKTTAFVPLEFFELIHSSVPEALVKDTTPNLMELSPFDALGVGPGIGISDSSKCCLEKCLKANKPLVIDADGLNLLSVNKELINELPPGTILTPHHGEWEKIFFKTDQDSLKINTSIEYCKAHNINILLKGYYSIFITPSSFFINGSGNNGMAKAGSGDVLTGILVSLLAQGYSAEDAGIIGMFVHGLAGDMARDTWGEDYMTASHLIHSLSTAFLSLRK